jgi:hypothetical protein
VTIPITDIIVSDQATLVSQVFVAVDGEADRLLGTQTFDGTSVLTINDANLFASNFSPGGAYGTTITLKLKGLRNPRTTSLTPSFIIETFSSTNTIDKVSSGLSL